MRILTIQDISCLGQCSMTVALPILSACGHETCILPTALLSTHTGGFHNPAITQLAPRLPGIREHWAREGIRFDAIYTGYLGSVEAIRETEQLIAELLAPEGLVIVDPAMADNGRLYYGFDREYAEAMGELCRRAHRILPNVTEAAILSGMEYRENPDPGYVRALMEGLHHPCVILTGLNDVPGQTGAALLQKGTYWEYRHRRIGKSFHGTGDLFASAFTGSCLLGKTLEQSVEIAADTVCESISMTLPDPGHWYGVKFEKAIPYLVRRLGL